MDTREKILTNAASCFLEKGYAGTSMSMIAKRADVTQSLIFHHFENKENLWEAVQKKCTTTLSSQIAVKVKETTTLRNFIEYYVSARFNFFLKNPELVRMMGWQRLDAHPSKKPSSEITLNPVENLTRNIEALQGYGQIRTDLSPNTIALMMMHMVTAPLIDRPTEFLTDTTLQQDFLKTVVVCLIDGLAP